MIINETNSQILIILFISIYGFFSAYAFDLFNLFFIKLKKIKFVNIFCNFISYLFVFLVFYFANLRLSFGEIRLLPSVCFFVFFIINRTLNSIFLAKWLKKCYNKFKVKRNERIEKVVENTKRI